MTLDANPPFADHAIAARFASFPDAVRQPLLNIRRLIFEIARRTEGVGPIEEALRWGQPSFLTTRSGSGSTVRIDATGSGGYAVYFICHTNLVDTFASMYPGTFRVERNRALLFDLHDQVPAQELGHCLALALTYHARTTRKRGRPRKAG